MVISRLEVPNYGDYQLIYDVVDGVSHAALD